MDFKAGLYDASGTAITGSTDLKIKIKRDADDYFYDFNDSTFKNAAWTTIAATMTEVDATNVPGEYERAVDVSAWNNGVYTVYFQYSGSPAWTDAVEFRVYDGKESSPLAEQLGTQAKADVNAEADSALSDYAPNTVIPDAAGTAADLHSATDGKIDTAISNIATLDGKADAIQAKTDNLPSDPADDSEIDDQLEAIQAGIDTLLAHNVGAGAIEWTYTLTDADTGFPIADADVWVTTDEAGENVIASGRTNQSGVVTFYLDAGTVYVWRQKSGWNFENPDTEAVS